MPQREYEDPYRPLPPDIDEIHFAHADLHLGKIIIFTPPGSASTINGIMDRERSGWYPSYWEFCKMAWVVDEGSEG